MNDQQPLRVAVVSLGCPKNLVDTEKMLALLAQSGQWVGARMDQADVILINTCAFIAPARQESMQAIRRALLAKRRGQVRRVVVAGCLPQKQSSQLERRYPQIDAVIGVFDRDRIVQAVTGSGPVRRVSPPSQACHSDLGRLRLTPRHWAYLRLSEGCDNRCAYCTIPSIRGPLRSKPMVDVLREARELVADGAVELNLIAQDTAAYGRDLPGRCDLAGLLARLDKIDGLRWIRLMYAHPAGMSDRLISALADCSKAVPYLDLPLQHINGRLLGLMRRRYDRRQVEELIRKLRRRLPNIALRTSFIVGFPGETRGEFKELLEFVRQARFDAAGVFTYSREAGTPAARMGSQVSPATAAARRRELMLAQQEGVMSANAARVGKSLEVLVDGPDGSGRCVGRHAGQAPQIDSLCLLEKPCPAGSFIRARVSGTSGYDLLIRPTGGIRD